MAIIIGELEKADGLWTGPEGAVMDAIPQSLAFRNICQEVTYDKAKAHVFADELERPADNEQYNLLVDSDKVKGYAIVTNSPEESFTMSQPESVRRTPDTAGKISIQIAHVFADRNKIEADRTLRWFKRRIEQMMTDIVDYIRDRGGLNITQFQISEGPVTVDEVDQAGLGCQYWASLLLEWSNIRLE